MKLKELIAHFTEKEKTGTLPENLQTYLDDFIPNVLAKSETLQQAYGITTKEMEELYAKAYEFYQSNKYQEAFSLFRWLLIFNPFIQKYWMGFAASQQLLKLYEGALHGYAVAALLQDENPYPHFHAYECYMSLENREEALKALEEASELAAANSTYFALNQEILQLKRRNTCIPQ